jgi:hypothetical protein
MMDAQQDLKRVEEESKSFPEPELFRQTQLTQRQKSLTQYVEDNRAELRRRRGLP